MDTQRLIGLFYMISILTFDSYLPVVVTTYTCAEWQLHVYIYRRFYSIHAYMYLGTFSTETPVRTEYSMLVCIPKYHRYLLPLEAVRREAGTCGCHHNPS